MPIVCLEALLCVIAVGEVGVAFNRDVIVVVKADELAEPEVTGVRSRLVRDAFHQIAIAGDEPGVMINDRVIVAIERTCEMRFSNRHADSVAEPLTEWAGGVLDSRCIPVVGVAGSSALPLPELLDIL